MRQDESVEANGKMRLSGEPASDAQRVADFTFEFHCCEANIVRLPDKSTMKGSRQRRNAVSSCFSCIACSARAKCSWITPCGATGDFWAESMNGNDRQIRKETVFKILDICTPKSAVE